MNHKSQRWAAAAMDAAESLAQAVKPARWLIAQIASAATVAAAFLLAWWTRFDFRIPEEEWPALWPALPVVLAVKIGVFNVFRLYDSLWRYVSIADLVRLFTANGAATALLLGLWYFGAMPDLPRSALVLDFLLCFFAMSGKRVAVRILGEMAAGAGERDVTTLIVGSPEAANSLLHAFSINPGRRHVAGLLCDGAGAGRTLRGIPFVGGVDEAGKAVQSLGANELLLLPPYSTTACIRKVLAQLEELGVACALRMVPAYTDIADGSIGVSHIKEVEIEDLLGRKPVRLDNSEVSALIKGRRIMVTGAGGSIGSELCRQIAAYGPELLVLFELSEYNLYEISMELGKSHPRVRIASVIGDVRERWSVASALEAHGVQMVYHAAAYKHVPLMEENPSAALLTNTLGSANVADCCEAAGVARMVMISTDKAVGPTSVMGASKRLAERLVLERAIGRTEFVAVRFGNVLGSSGSVIPLFKRQLREGGPLTVTSPEVTRYFMSIPEAVDLVLQAASVGRDRDIMVLEMGEPVKIIDMARKLIELSGLRPGVDVEITITGLRPGEKEYEELLTAEERADATRVDRVHVAKKEPRPSDTLDPEEIRAAALAGAEAVREYMRRHIPDNQLG